jgi:hypothetical protein
MKVLLAPDTSDHPNWGCRAMGAWFRTALPRAGATSLMRVGSRWFYGRHRELPDLSTIAQIRLYAEDIRRGRILPRFSATLRECDFVLLNGENFIRPGTRKGRNLLFLAHVAKTVFDKPCVLTNHSADLGEPRLAEIVREVYPLLDEVHFREQTSVEQAAGFVAPGCWRLFPDVAWTIVPASIAGPGDAAAGHNRVPAPTKGAAACLPRGAYVTVCGSSAFSLPRCRGADIAPAFIELCRRLCREVGPVVLAAPDECDQRIMREVRSALHLPILDLRVPIQQAIDVIGNAAVHIGGRWHPGIFATCGGTPWVPLSANNHKVHSLVRQIGFGGTVFDVSRVGDHINDIVAQAHALAQGGPSLRARLKRRAGELAAQVHGNLDFLRRTTERDQDLGNAPVKQATNGFDWSG